MNFQEESMVQDAKIRTAMMEAIQIMFQLNCMLYVFLITSTKIPKNNFAQNCIHVSCKLTQKKITEKYCNRSVHYFLIWFQTETNNNDLPVGLFSSLRNNPVFGHCKC